MYEATVKVMNPFWDYEKERTFPIMEIFPIIFYDVS